jgi:UDP-N-acetylenolpyruvoylglucosamine reductase
MAPRCGNGPDGSHPFMDVNAGGRHSVQTFSGQQYAAVAMRSLKLALAGLCVAAFLPGCGGSDDNKTTGAVQGDQRGILATVDALQTASHAGDGGKICTSVFTKSLVRSIEKAAKRSCAAEVKENLFKPGASISADRNITVKGAAGTAVIREQNGNVSTLHLVKQARAWRIDRVTAQS